MSENFSDEINHVELIREVFKYARRFVSKRFVIQISSELFEHRLFPSLVRDLAFLQHSGIQLLLVPGSRLRIDTILRQFNKEWEFRDGLRITAEESLPLIVMAAFDVANRLMTEFSSQQLNSVIGNWVQSQGLGVVNGSDFQMTGTVKKINIAQIERIMDDGIIPILPCIGWSSIGQAYNLSSLELARALAIGLGAEKLFYINDSFFLNAHELDLGGEEPTLEGRQITGLTAQGAATLLERNSSRLTKVDRDIIRQSIQASTGGVERVHILDGTTDGVILREIFSTRGSGTLIHVNPFNAIRSMEPQDISDVLRIIQPEVERGNLLARNRDDLLRTQADFVVYEADGSIRGCAALHRYERGVAELAAIAVDPIFSKLGIGNQLVRYLLNEARKRNMKKIFALTTQAADWFLSMGFLRAELSEIPEERRDNSNRNSRAYCLKL